MICKFGRRLRNSKFQYRGGDCFTVRGAGIPEAVYIYSFQLGFDIYVIDLMITA